MPFTFSHPAAAVPFRRLGLPLSALVIGAMTPDFLYFLALEATPMFGHTVPGIFLFCVPAGLVALWAFHRVLKWPLIDLMPGGWRDRVAAAAMPFRFGPPRRFLLVCCALALGAATHVIWDGFTHSTGWAVGLMPWLRGAVDLGLPEPIPGFRIAQHVSTVIGGALLAFWSARWVRRQEPGPVPNLISERARTAAWLVIPAAAIMAGILNADRFASIGDPFWMIRSAVIQGAVGFVVGLMVSSLLLAIAWHVIAFRRGIRRTVRDGHGQQ